MKNKLFTTFIFFITVGIFTININKVFATDLCPSAGSLSGYWVSFSPTNRQCTTSYYTYNTTNLDNEESWYISNAMYILCNKSVPPLGPNYYYDIGSRVYIPSPHNTQTSSAHYYRWQDSSNFGMIGNINQYGTFGWANLSTTTYTYIDQWKISDWTNESLYSKTVDLDAFSITNCP